MPLQMKIGCLCRHTLTVDYKILQVTLLKKKLLSCVDSWNKCMAFIMRNMACATLCKFKNLFNIYNLSYVKLLL